ncbi:MAG: hydroxymethylbilane synthase [Bacillota bacterium]|nr:hydroxymethylbilane synthase [Bacillota bacterium]
MKVLKLGTRGSKLALWQAEYVKQQLILAVDNIEVEIKVIRTKGDKILDVALSKIGDRGLFTKEIENELLAGNIDLAVHSMKDMPSVLAEGLCVGAVLEREDAADVLLSHKGYTLDELPEKAIVGTSSLRRIAQLKAFRPDLQMVDIRGNVETRLRKMIEQDMDGIVLAYAGVRRLGFEKEITQKLPFELILPAVGQGAIAIENRKNDQGVQDIVSKINNENAWFSTKAERSFLAELEGGCQVPIACNASLIGGKITIHGLVASLNGLQVIKGSCSGSKSEAKELGKELAQSLLQDGAGEILEEINNMGEMR